MVKQVIDVNFLTSLPQERLHVSQYDFGERVFEFHAYVGDNIWNIPEGSTIMLNGHKPSDPPTSFFVPCTYTGNVITCDCKNTMTDVFGLVECELMVTTASGLIQSTNIILDVEKAPVQTGDIPSSDYEAIQSMIGSAGTDAARAEAGAATATQKAQEAAQSAQTAENIVVSKITEYNNDTIQPALDGLETSIDELNTAAVKYKDITRASNITAEQKKAVDAVELNPSTENTLAYKLGRRVESKKQNNTSLTPAQLDALVPNGSVVAVPYMKLSGSILPNMAGAALYYRNNDGYGGGIMFGDGGPIVLRKSNSVYYHERINTRVKSFSISGIVCAGMITSSQKQILFFVPYPLVAGGTATLKTLSVVVRHADGGYPFVRSGTNGATYTQLGSSSTPLWTNSKAARTNELNGNIGVTIRDGIGIQFLVNFVYAIAKASGNTAAVTNNVPIILQVTAEGTVA